jgi:hypothetical protein
MMHKTQKREVTKAKEVANEYKKKGYRVIFEPSVSELPEELKILNFQPDIIAMSDDINLVIEVKTFESIKNPALIELAEKVKAIEGWDFELVYTNPKNKAEISVASELSTYIDAKRNLDRAAKFLDTDAGKEYSDAAFLLVWGAVENALRVNYETYKPNDKESIPRALIRDSVIWGIIGRNDQVFLESMMVTRNEIVHGMFKGRVLRADLNSLIKLGKNIIEQIS